MFVAAPAEIVSSVSHRDAARGTLRKNENATRRSLGMTRMDTIETTTGSVEQLLSVRRHRNSEASATPHGRIESRMARELGAMVVYSLATGVGVPPDLMAQDDKALPAVEP